MTLYKFPNMSLPQFPHPKTRKINIFIFYGDSCEVLKIVPWTQQVNILDMPLLSLNILYGFINYSFHKVIRKCKE